MFKNLSEVKEFIEWASKMGVARAKIGEVEFDIYSAKLLEQANLSQIMENTTEPGVGDQESDEELFWSSGG